MRFPPFHSGSQQCFVEDMIGLDWIPLDALRFQNQKKKNSTQIPPPHPPREKINRICWNIAKYVCFKKKKCLDFGHFVFFSTNSSQTGCFRIFYPTSSHRLGTASPTNINRALPNKAINWAMGQRAASNTCQGKSTLDVGES